jgi:hypothetical protein
MLGQIAVAVSALFRHVLTLNAYMTGLSKLREGTNLLDAHSNDLSAGT